MAGTMNHSTTLSANILNYNIIEKRIFSRFTILSEPRRALLMGPNATRCTQDPEIALRWPIPLFRRLAIPTDGFGVVSGRHPDRLDTSSRDYSEQPHIPVQQPGDTT